MQAKQLEEKVVNKGGANGDTIVPDPIAKNATLPNSKDQGEKTNPNITAKDCEDETPQEGGNASAAANKATLNMKPSGASAKMEEYTIEVAFEGEELSEEFKEKAVTIFEAAVNAKVEQIKTSLQEQFNTQLEEKVTEINTDLLAQVDNYLTYVVEQWMEENEVAIDSGLRSEITEDFIEGMRDLFVENYIEIPDDKLDVLEELANKVQELEQKLNESLNSNIDLTQTVKEYAKQDILAKVSEGLTLTQKEKFATLAEGVEFVDEESYAKKLEIVKQTTFKTNVGQDIIEEEVEHAEEVTAPEASKLSGPVASYVKAITRTSKK